MEFLIKLIAAHARKIVATCVKEHRVQETARGFHRKRLARSNLAVEFQETVRIVVGRILQEARLKLRLISEHLLDFRVRAEAERTEQHRDRHLSRSVDTHVKDIVRIGLVLEPSAAVRDHLAEVAFLSDLIVLNGIINAGGTNQLAYDDALRAVDHEGTGVRHERQIAHEHLVLLVLILILIIQPHLDLHRGCIGGIPLLALRNAVLCLIAVELEIHKIQTEVSGKILNGENIAEHFPQSLTQEPVVRILLDLYEVRHLQNFLLTGEAHANAFSGFNRTHIAFFHITFHPCFLKDLWLPGGLRPKGHTSPHRPMSPQ